MTTSKTAIASSLPGVGPLLREWRKRRRRTQLELSLEAGISARHLSFVENGRAKPSAEMVLLLAERLEVPLRERNQLLLAAGHAPSIPHRSLKDDELAPVRASLDLILKGHEPFPAVVVDRGWNLVAANSSMISMASWVDPSLLKPPVNVMRVGLHPRGLARFTLNLDEVRSCFLGRLARQVAITGDPELSALLEEVSGYGASGPGAHEAARGVVGAGAGAAARGASGAAHEADGAVGAPPAGGSVASPILTPLMKMRSPTGEELSFVATVATFGIASEVTTSELSIELTFPADEATTKAMEKLTAKAMEKLTAKAMEKLPVR